MTRRGHRGDGSVIAGRDRGNPNHLVVEGIDERIVGKQMEYGTVNAVYPVFRTSSAPAGCGRMSWTRICRGEQRWQSARIAYRYHPQFRARGGLFNFSALRNGGYLHSPTDSYAVPRGVSGHSQ